MYNLVTGAGGTIGSELCKRLDNVLALGHGENSLYNLDCDCKTVLADIRDQERMEEIFSRNYLRAIYHTAAHKHVNFCQDNPSEAVENNVMGTLNLLRLARRYGVQHFVFVSTDKAVEPINVMGHTKRLGEYLTLDAGYTVVRLGNIWASRGSVVPFWREQIANGGPLTITDKRMSRYFTSASKAVTAILKAKGNRIHVPMMRLYKMIDIAKYLIGDKDIPIIETGRVEGEKFVEKLFYDDEVPEMEDGLWVI